MINILIDLTHFTRLIKGTFLRRT